MHLPKRRVLQTMFSLIYARWSLPSPVSRLNLGQNLHEIFMAYELASF
jgi:hypothetical protein